LVKLNGMRHKGSRSGDYLPLNNHFQYPVRPTLQPLTYRNEPLCVVPLLGDTGASVHDSQSKRRHITVQSRQLDQQLPIFADHSCVTFPLTRHWVEACSEQGLAGMISWCPGGALLARLPGTTLRVMLLIEGVWCP
jgi:hypothetical protein